MPTERRWLTILEAAAFLSVNPKTASAWALSGRLPAARIGGRGPWRIDRLRLEEGLERQIKDNRPGRETGGVVALRRYAPPRSTHKGQHERAG